jgi:hypothetical protein
MSVYLSVSVCVCVCVCVFVCFVYVSSSIAERFLDVSHVKR